MPVYGGRHRRLRAEALDHLVDGDPCARCSGPMFRSQAAWLDLDHDDADPTRYRGLAHARCNRRAGAVKGNRARGRDRRRPRIWRSRVW